MEAVCKDDDLEVPDELAEDNYKLIQRWVMYNLAESREKEGECVWGRTGLRWIYFMRMKGLTSWRWEVMVNIQRTEM